MKILILSWRCIKNPGAGGSEIYFHELAKRWVEKGIKVVWFSPKFKGAKSEEDIDGIKIIRAGGRFSVYLHACKEYLFGRLKDSYDAVIDVENGIPFFSPLYINKRKLILHIHHYHKDVWPRESKFPVAQLGSFLESYVMPVIYRGVEVGTLSNSSAEEIVSEGLSKKQPFIIPPGIDFYKKNHVKKTKYPSLLFLNRIRKYKGVLTLLEAAEILQNKNFEVKVLIAGGGQDLDMFKKISNDKNLKNVSFLGKVSDSEKKKLMQECWAFVNPSSKEGWGIVNIEANYARTPAIGSRVSGIKDSIIEGKTGLLFEQDNALELAKKIEKIISDNKLRLDLEKNALSWAMNFDWNSKAERYLEEVKKRIR